MWLRALFHRDEVERDLDDELRFHLERETEKYIRQGMTPEEAERRARQAFGGLERIKDDARDARGAIWIDALIHDVRHTLRGIRRRPGFAVAVVLTLGLGLGANIAMFGIVDRLLFRPPAYLADPGRVHRVYFTERQDGSDQTSANLPYTTYRDLARWTTNFSTVAAYISDNMAIGTGEATQVMRVAAVSASYFDLFNAHPVAGRFFSAREDSVGAGTPVAVISWAFWQTRYGGRPAIGDSLEVGPMHCTIIGVAPPGFTGVSDDGPAAAFVPINAYGPHIGMPHPSDYYSLYSWRWMQMLARRRPGVSVAAATADLTHAFRMSHEAERAADATVASLEVAKPRVAIAPIQSERGPKATNFSRVAVWTSGVALIVLLIACANVANLFLVRAIERRREYALRVALGVSRARLVAQVLAEVAVFTVPAAIVAIAIAAAGSQVLGTLFLPGALATTVLNDPRTLVFAGAVALLAIGLTAAVPLLEIGRTSLAALIKDGARDSGRRGSRVRIALLFLQGALSVVLLVGAGLFVRSLQNVRTMRLGFDADPVLLVDLMMRDLKLSNPERIALAHRLLDEARTIPGVSSAAGGLTIPLRIMLSEDVFTATHDSVPKAARDATFQIVSPEYFRAFGTRVLRGRPFTDGDRTGAPLVIIVSEAMAKAVWPGQEAIGQCLRIEADTLPCRTVVGVTEGIKQASLSDGPGLQYYLPLDQWFPAFYPFGPSLFIRIEGDAGRAAETVRRRLQHLMPGTAYVTVTPMRDIIGSEERSWQLGATMFVALGVLALVLAAVGLYSVIAYGVAQRTRELGVRMALGARTGDVLWLVLGDGVRFTILGLAIGGAIALALGRLVEPLLFGERATDPLVFGVVTGILALTAIAASILPAQRASRVDPNIALRAD